MADRVLAGDRFFLTGGAEVARVGDAAEFRALDEGTGEDIPDAAQAVNPASKSMAASSMRVEAWMFIANERSRIAAVELDKFSESRLLAGA